MADVSILADRPIHPVLLGLITALALGLLVGLERGWQEREQPEGSRVAGLRTFALIGLFGGLAATLHREFGPGPLVAGLIALAGLGVMSYRVWVRRSGSLSITTVTAALLTYLLGAFAASGTADAPLLAMAVAVIVAVVLDLKSTLHRWLRLIQHRELGAALQLLVLSVVILPLLPDLGMGPYQALNPHRLWWAVVLVSALSLAGHVAMRVSGPQRGLLWSGLLGGLASSTAATLALARRARLEPAVLDAAAAGTLGACAVMFLRIAVLVAMLNARLGRDLALALSTSAAVLLVLALWRWHRHRPDAGVASGGEQVAPFDLSVALGFAALLGVTAVATRAAHDAFGAGGLYGLSLVSGLADVDAIVISISRLATTTGLGSGTALLAIGLAALANMVSKSVVAALAGTLALGRQVWLGNCAALAMGAVVGALTVI